MNQSLSLVVQYLGGTDDHGIVGKGTLWSYNTTKSKIK